MNLKEQIKRIEDLKKIYKKEKDDFLSQDEEAFSAYLKGRGALFSAQMDFSIDKKLIADQGVFHRYVQKARYGVVDAYDYMTSKVQFGKHKLSIDFIQGLHGCLLGFVSPECAGIWREAPARWMNSTMIVSNYRKIKYLMNELVDGFNNNVVPAFYWEEMPNAEYQAMAGHPVMKAIQINYDIVSIHPFSDGNKRLACLLSNFVLLGSGFAPLSIVNREKYISGIENYFNTRKPEAFYQTMFQEIEQSHRDVINEVRSFPKSGKPGLIVQHGNKIRDSLNKQLFQSKEYC